MELTPDGARERLDCGHTSGELFTFQGPGVFTDHETGEKVCRKCSDSRHYDRVRKQYEEIEAKAAREGWSYEYLSTYGAYVRSGELIGKLVCRAYWRRDPNGADARRGVLQPAYMYNSAFKRLKSVVPNSPVTGFALLFEDGSKDPLCYDQVCVVTREPALTQA